MNKIVSVIIPTHNRANLLKRAIQSVLKQTFKDFEIIIVDDNSKDNTKEVVKRFKDKRIKYFFKSRFPHNPASTRNEGIKKAKGKYIAFLDDDDEWFPEKLELQLKEFKLDKNIGLVYTKCIVFEGDKIKRITNAKRVSIPSVMIKREVINEIGLFDENLDCVEDRDMWLRISKKYKFKFTNQILTKVNLHKQGQISLSIENKIKSEKYFIKKYLLEKFKDGTLHRNYFRLGSLCVKNSNFKEAEKYFRTSFYLKQSLRPLIYLFVTKSCPRMFREVLIRK